MATVITAGNATNGLSLSADNFGALEFKTGSGAGTTALTLSSAQVATVAAGVEGTTGSFSGNMSFNSGYGSAAIAYGCRAWVNFNGTGTVAIRASGNVTSITDNGTGNYSVNFTTAMPDTNYAAVGSTQGSGFGTLPIINVNQDNDQTVSKVDVVTTVTSSGTATDLNYITVAVFR